MLCPLLVFLYCSYYSLNRRLERAFSSLSFAARANLKIMGSIVVIVNRRRRRRRRDCRQNRGRNRHRHRRRTRLFSLDGH